MQNRCIQIKQMMLQGIHVKHDVMCGEAVIDQSPSGQQQSYVAES